MSFFDDSLQLLAFELLEELPISPRLLQISEGTLGLTFLGPNTPFRHLCFDFGVFVVIDVFAVDLFPPDSGQTAGEQFDDDILRIVEDVSEFGFVDFLLDDEGEGFP